MVKSKTLTILLVLLLVIIGGYFAYRYNTYPPSVDNNQDNQSNVLPVNTGENTEPLSNLNKNIAMNPKDVYFTWKRELYAATSYNDVYNVIFPKYFRSKVTEELKQHTADFNEMPQAQKDQSLIDIKRFPSADEITVTREDVKDTTAVLYISSTKKEYSFGGEVHLVKEDGQWKIDYEKWNNR